MIEPVGYKRCAPDSPRRCQATIGSGQCPYEAMEDLQVCPMHGHNVQSNQRLEQAKRTYTAAKWKAQIGEFADSNNLKSLREEIGVLRLLLQEKLQGCATTNDLLLQSSSISELVLKISKLVSDCHRLDTSLGVMLDKTQLDLFGQRVIQIISECVTDPELMQIIATKMVHEIKNTGTPENRFEAMLGGKN